MRLFALCNYYLNLKSKRTMLTKNESKTSRLSVFLANDYKLNSSSVAKESAGTAVESGVLIRINERAFPEI